MYRSSLSAGAIALAAALAGPAPAEPVPSANTALSAASNAAAVDLSFVVNGQVTNPGAEILASGHAPPAYNRKTVRATYARTTKILGGLVFRRSATTVQSTAAGSTAAGISATATASVGSFNGTLSSGLGKLITVTTGKVTSRASFTQTKAGLRTVKGGATVGNLKISAPALGIDETFNGTPQPNEVLYHNGDNSIVIYLNRQVRTTAGGKLAAISVDAVDVQIRKFKLAGNTISGRIEVCPTFAR